MITRFDNHDVLGSGYFSTESEGFNLLPLDMIRHIFLMIFKDKDHFNVFSYASQVSKRFYFLLDWSKTIFSPSIPSMIPFQHYHFIAAIRKGQRYSIKNLNLILKNQKSENQQQVKCKELTHCDNFACPFITAIEAGQIEIFKELFEKQSYDFNIGEIFKIAVKKGSLDVVEFLEEKGYVPSDTNNPVFLEELRLLALQSKNIKMLEKFLPKEHLALNKPQQYFRYVEDAISQFTPETKQKSLEIIQYLFTNKGPEIGAIDHAYKLTDNPFIGSMQSRDWELSLLVWNSGLFPFNEGYFWQACKYGHHQLIALFLKLPKCVLIRETWEYIDLAMKGIHLKVIENCLKSPKMMISPLIKESLPMIQQLAEEIFFYFSIFAIGAVLCVAVDIAATGIIDLTTVRTIAAISTMAFVLVSSLFIALGIIAVLVNLLFVLYKTAHAVGFLAYHQIKMRLLA